MTFSLENLSNTDLLFCYLPDDVAAVELHLLIRGMQWSFCIAAGLYLFQQPSFDALQSLNSFLGASLQYQKYCKNRVFE